MRELLRCGSAPRGSPAFQKPSAGVGKLGKHNKSSIDEHLAPEPCGSYTDHVTEPSGQPGKAAAVIIGTCLTDEETETVRG